MKKVVVKRNNFIEYEFNFLEGYVFNPRNKNISRLNVINEDFIKFILSKKIKRKIYMLKRTIKLMISSDITIKTDCDLMIDEILKLVDKLENKYIYYFDKFEYFDYVKDLYLLDNIIKYKKRIIDI